MLTGGSGVLRATSSPRNSPDMGNISNQDSHAEYPGPGSKVSPCTLSAIPLGTLDSVIALVTPSPLYGE